MKVLSQVLRVLLNDEVAAGVTFRAVFLNLRETAAR